MGGKNLIDIRKNPNLYGGKTVHLWRTAGILMKFMAYHWNPNVTYGVQLES